MHLEKNPQFRAATEVALYAHMGNELPTDGIFTALRERGVPTLFPRCRPEGDLAFVELIDWRALEPGRHGVFEPPAQKAARRLSGGAVVLVPGVGFDREGHRLGRGGGYYDRTFAESEPGSPFLIGLGYAFQVVVDLPYGPRDRVLDAIVSEEGMRCVGT